MNRTSSNEQRVEGLSVTRSPFFVVMAALLLGIALVGFAPSFYLKTFFETPELPWYLHLHGAALTAWYILFLTQTLLVATNRTATHQRLGAFAAATAVLLVLTTFFLILGADASIIARGRVRQLPIEVVVLGDLSVLVVFSILVAVDKRATLLASAILVVPALGRIAVFPVFGEAGLAVPPVVLFSLMFAVWAHDLLTDKRLHATTAWGSALFVASFVAGTVLPRTEAGKTFVAAISLPGG